MTDSLKYCWYDPDIVDCRELRCTLRGSHHQACSFSWPGHLRRCPDIHPEPPDCNSIDCIDVTAFGDDPGSRVLHDQYCPSYVVAKKQAEPEWEIGPYVERSGTSDGWRPRPYIPQYRPKRPVRDWWRRNRVDTAGALVGFGSASLPFSLMMLGGWVLISVLCIVAGLILMGIDLHQHRRTQSTDTPPTTPPPTTLPKASEKRGGYSGSHDASEIKPPRKTPSASAKPKRRTFEIKLTVERRRDD